MIISKIKKQKDLRALRLDSAVEVAGSYGLLYEVTEEGFSVIQNIPGKRHPELGRVSYTFSDNGSKIHRGDTDYPLHPETQEYIIREQNLIMVRYQLAREQRRAQQPATSATQPCSLGMRYYTGPMPPKMPKCLERSVFAGFNE